MKQQWTGSKGKRRWFCGACGCSRATVKAIERHQDLMRRAFHQTHEGITKGAVQWG